jgi:membrane protein DedA with SNARE-associated domain
MSVEAIIARYGLVAVFAGAGFEGETAAIAGGLLVHQGYFPLVPAMIAAALGSFVADQLFFLLGRRFRDHRRVAAIRRRAAFARAIDMLERYPRSFIFGFRFIYGIRTVSPIAIGTSRISSRKFLIVNAVAAAVWGPLFVGLGYLFGHAIETLLGRIAGKHVLLIGAGAVLVLVAIVQGVRWSRTRAA